MIRMLASLLSILSEEDKGRCGATCPSCGEGCLAGVHPDQTHFCANGHTWGKAK